MTKNTNTEVEMETVRVEFDLPKPLADESLRVEDLRLVLSGCQTGTTQDRDSSLVEVGLGGDSLD